MKRPTEPTPMWWHKLDQSLYTVASSDGWAKEEYMLVPIEQWNAMVKKLSDKASAVPGHHSKCEIPESCQGACWDLHYKESD